MHTSGLIAGSRQGWERLSELLDQAERGGLAGLQADELDELGRLYRRATSDLSVARRDDVDPEIARYLNQLVSRAYARIYAGSRPRRLGLGRLFAVEVPQTFRKRASYIGVSVLLSVVAALASYTAVTSDPRWAGALFNPMAVERWRDFAESGTPAGEYFSANAEALGGPEFSGLLMSNNIQVALKAFAFGIVLMLGTIVVLVMNGSMLGVFIGVGANSDALLRFTSIIAPHGVVELSAIFIAGGAGLLIGHAIVDPGDLCRKDALRLAAADAVKLVTGTLPMFVVAGIIEGMISPQSVGLFGSDAPRILFGLLAGAAFWTCLFFGDRLWAGDDPLTDAD